MRSSSILADGARHLSFTGCEIGRGGTYAVRCRQGCRDISIRQSIIHDLGAGSIRIGETSIPPAAAEQTSHIAIDHNLYFHTSGDTPAYHSGTARCAFELHLEADSSFSHEWRNYASPCLAGPGLSIDKGTLQLPGGHTLPLPPGQSIRLGIETAPGPDATGTWSLTWLGFISNADSETTFYLDNLHLSN
jgi:hypothetical protein